MPFLSAKEALRMQLVDSIPDDPYAYLYDLMMDCFIYVGRPESPTGIENRL
jgi:hypothetical protein